jgi:hypothetical protein
MLTMEPKVRVVEVGGIMMLLCAAAIEAASRKASVA